MVNLLLFVLLVLLREQIRPVQASFSIALPLAVRSPYLSCWLPQLNGSSNAAPPYHSISPTRSNLSQTRDWDVFVRVDNNVYAILGSTVFPSESDGANLTSPPPWLASANITNTMVTPTRTTLTATAGPMQVNLTILNPVEPGDWVKQSIPFSYLSLTAIALDNSAHDMQVYSDIDGKWISGDNDQFMYWNVTSNTDVFYHTITFSDPVLFSEIIDQAGWGTLYYATKMESNITYTVSDRFSSLSNFWAYGSLDNQGGISNTPAYANGTAFAISRDLGTIQATQAPVVWAIGYTTDPAFSYAVQDNTPSQYARRPYYKLQYPNDEDLIVDFLRDFGNAYSRAQQLDHNILEDASSISGLLGDLVSLAPPHVYGSSQLTIGTDANGNFNESDVMMFMKNVGGDTPGRVNAVEVLYAAFPALMYIDPTLGTPLLEPLFRFQVSPDYGVQFAAKDLGSSYPSVFPGKSIHNQGVEQTGNMLIMTYANARASGDGSLISRYYSVLTSWADYLSNSSLNNAYQLDADETFTETVLGGNKSNLAIKGIIAIGAMSAMSLAAGHVADADKYSNITASLYAQWKTAALYRDQHLFAVENDTGTWTLGYNLFADVWLGTKVVESSVYDAQSTFLNNIPPAEIYPANETNFDLPVENVNTDATITVSSWNLFVAAMTPNDDLRANRISRVHNRASLFGNQSMGAFPFRYDSGDGSDISGIASPAQGAMFAPLFQKIPVRTIQFNSMTTSPRKTSYIGRAARAVIAVVAALLVVGIVAFMWYRRRYNIHRSSASSSDASSSTGTVSRIRVTPFIPSHFRTTHGNPMMPWMEWQGPQSELNADGHDPYSSSLPPGLYSQPFPFDPIGLSAKELARIRAETLHSRPAVTHPESDESPSPPPSLPVATTEQRAMTSSPMFRTLQSQVDRLWREMRQLRAERSDSEAPPTYAESEVSHHSGGV